MIRPFCYYLVNQQVTENNGGDETPAEGTLFGYPAQAGYAEAGAQYIGMTVGEGQLSLELVWDPPAPIISNPHQYLKVPTPVTTHNILCYSPDGNGYILMTGANSETGLVSMESMYGRNVYYIVIINDGDLDDLQYLLDNLALITPETVKMYKGTKISGGTEYPTNIYIKYSNDGTSIAGYSANTNKFYDGSGFPIENLGSASVSANNNILYISFNDAGAKYSFEKPEVDLKIS